MIIGLILLFLGQIESESADNTHNTCIRFFCVWLTHFSHNIYTQQHPRYFRIAFDCRHRLYEYTYLFIFTFHLFTIIV